MPCILADVFMQGRTVRIVLFVANALVLGVLGASSGVYSSPFRVYAGVAHAGLCMARRLSSHVAAVLAKYYILWCTKDIINIYGRFFQK